MTKLITPTFALAMLTAFFVPTFAEAQTTFRYQGLTHSEYQSMFDALVPQGCRPTYVRVFSRTGQPRYDLTMVRQSGPSWIARHGQNDQQFVQTNQDLAASGYRLTLHSSARINGRIIHVAMWIR